MAHFLYTLIIYPVYEIIEVAFVMFYRFFKNPGMATIGVSFAVTLLCLPLYIVAERWQERERQAQLKLKPGAARIKKAFKGDEQYMILSTFYRQNHYHPMMALRSSFSLLIQVPFFMAAYSYLSNLEILRGFSFLFVRDMGRPDALFTVAGFSVNVLPILMTAINCVAGAIYSQGHDAREKIQIYGMAAIFLVILYDSPAGLVIYWTMNNVLSLVKNIFYKFKNPLRALYKTLLAVIAIAIVYLIFVNDGTTVKRIYAALAFVLLAFIPLLLKFVRFLLQTALYKIVEDKKLRFCIFIFSSLALCFLFSLMIPSSLILSSVQEFSDIEGPRSPTYFVLNAMVQAAGLFVLWPLCVYFLFGKNIQTLIATFFSAALFCGILNAYVFPGSYGSLNNTLVFLDGFKQMPALLILLNLFCACLVAAAVVLLCRFFPRAVQSAAFIFAFTSLLFGAISGFKILGRYKIFEEKIASGTARLNEVKPVFHLSKNGRNVVVIMLDRAENIFVPPIFESHPQLKEDFSGFTFYENTVSYNGHTLLSAPSLFGGYEYTPLEMNKRRNASNLQKHTESLLLLPRIFTEQADFTAEVSDLSWAGYSLIPDMSIADGFQKINGFNLQKKYTNIWKEQNPDFTNGKKVVFNNLRRNLLWFSLFRTSPAAIRKFVYYDGSWWALNPDVDADDILDCYSVLDFLPALTKVEDGGENHFVAFVNELSHSSDVIRLPVYDNDDTGPYAECPGYSNNAASYILLSKWFSYLKENGCYDNTRIVIASDHGMGLEEEGETVFKTPDLNGYMKDHFHSILFVKDFGQDGNLAVDSDSFMTMADVPTIALNGIVQSPVNPFTKNPVDDKIKEGGALVTSSNRHQPDYHIHPNYFTIEKDEWWLVKENIFKDENWKQGVPK